MGKLDSIEQNSQKQISVYSERFATDLFERYKEGSSLEKLRYYVFSQIQSDLLEGFKMNYSRVSQSLIQKILRLKKEKVNPNHLQTIFSGLEKFYERFGFSCRFFEWELPEPTEIVSMLLKYLKQNVQDNNLIIIQRAFIELLNYLRIAYSFGLVSDIFIYEIINLVYSINFTFPINQDEFCNLIFSTSTQSSITEISPPIAEIGQSEYMIRHYSLKNGKISVFARSIPLPPEDSRSIYIFDRSIPFENLYSTLSPENLRLINLVFSSDRSNFDFICLLLLSYNFQIAFENTSFEGTSIVDLIDFLGLVPSSVINEYLNNKFSIFWQEIVNLLESEKDSKQIQLSIAILYDQFFNQFFDIQSQKGLLHNQSYLQYQAQNNNGNSGNSGTFPVFTECRTNLNIDNSRIGFVRERLGDEFKYRLVDGGVQIYDINSSKSIAFVPSSDSRFGRMYDMYVCENPRVLNDYVRNEIIGEYDSEKDNPSTIQETRPSFYPESEFNSSVNSEYTDWLSFIDPSSFFEKVIGFIVAGIIPVNSSSIKK